MAPAACRHGLFARLTSIVNPVAVFTPGGTGTEPGRCRFGLFDFDLRTGELRARAR